MQRFGIRRGVERSKKRSKITYICGCCEEETTTELEYTKYPYDISDCMISCDKLENDKWLTIKNPFSGESYRLKGIEESVYAVIMGSQMFPGYMKNPKLQQGVRKGLDWFRDNNAKAYMVLLD